MRVVPAPASDAAQTIRTEDHAVWERCDDSPCSNVSQPKSLVTTPSMASLEDIAAAEERMYADPSIRLSQQHSLKPPCSPAPTPACTLQRPKLRSNDDFMETVTHLVLLYDRMVEDLKHVRIENDELRRNATPAVSVSLDSSGIQGVKRASRISQNTTPTSFASFVSNRTEAKNKLSIISRTSARRSGAVESKLSIASSTFVATSGSCVDSAPSLPIPQVMMSALKNISSSQEDDAPPSTETLKPFAKTATPMSSAYKYPIDIAWLPNGLAESADGIDVARSTSFSRQHFSRSSTKVFSSQLFETSSFLVISPESQIRLCWDILVFLIASIDALVIPFQLAFGRMELRTGGLSFAFAIFWLFDIAVNCFTAFYEGGQLVKEHIRIVRRYACTWFIPDLCLASNEWIAIAVSFGHSSTSVVQIGRVFRYLRLLKIVRLHKLKQLLHIVSDSIDTESRAIVFNLCCYAVILLVISHYIACVWYAVGVGSHEAKSWVQRRNMDAEPVSYHYCVSLFWALTLFASASDVFPANQTEQWVAVSMVAASIIMFSSLLAMVTGSVMQLWALRNEHRKQSMLLKRYLRTAQISAQTTSRIEHYLEHLQAQTQSYVPAEQVLYLQKLSAPLKEQLRFESFRPILSKHELTAHMTSQTRAFINAVSSLPFARGDDVFHCGDDAVHAVLLADVTLDDLTYWPGRIGQMAGVESAASTAPVKLGGEDSMVVAEAALWTQWVYVGDLEAGAMCQVLTIGSNELHDVASKDVSFCRSMSRYVYAYLEALRELSSDSVSDVMEINVLQELEQGGIVEVGRSASEVSSAFGFLGVFGKQGSLKSRGSVASKILRFL